MSTKIKPLFCMLWLVIPMLLTSCGGSTGNVPDTSSVDIEPGVSVSSHVPAEEAAPAETERQETSIPEEPAPIVEEEAESTQTESTEPGGDVSNRELSAFTGVYSMYDEVPFNTYGYPPTIVIDDNGRINGQILSGKTPIRVTQNDNGTITCMISEGKEEFDEIFGGFLSIEPQEFYVICPVGVTSGFDGYPDYDDLVGTDTVRIRYVVIDGGIIDIIYQKIN